VLFVMVESADFIPNTKIALAVAAVLTLVALTAVMIGVQRRR